MIFTFADFQLVYVLTRGGPANATHLFATYAFDVAMGAGQLGQGASIAIESAVQLARCLRDIPDLSTAFATYEQMRRPRVEKIAAYGARNNSNKVSGPVGKAMMNLITPIESSIVAKLFRLARKFGYPKPFNSSAPGKDNAMRRNSSGVIVLP